MIDLSEDILHLDPVLEIQKTGKYLGKTAYAFQIFGRRPNLTANVLQDVGEALAAGTNLFPVLTGAETIQAISSDANDDGSPAGTGARTIKVTYINTSYEMVTTGDITLNGTTAVTVLASGMLYYLWAEVTTVGSNGTAVGNVTIRTSAPTTLSQISAGTNRSMDAGFMVPDGFKAYVPRWKWGALANSQDFRLRATVDCHDRVLSTVFHFQDGQNCPADTGDYNDLPWLEYPARCKITGSTISSSGSAGTRAGVSFHMILIAD